MISNHSGVSIEVSMPYGDSLKLFGICWEDNPVDIIVRNDTDSSIHFYEDWNSWGYFNFKFEIETNDSVYTVSRIKPGGWWKNFPSYYSINPNESLVFHYNLIDSSCINVPKAIRQIKGSKEWVGLPQKEYDQAKIRVIYELNEDYKFVANRGYENLISYMEGKSDSLIRRNDTTYIYSERIISKPLNIEIIK